MLPPLLRKFDIREHRPDLIQGIFHQEGKLIVPVIVGNGARNMDFLFKKVQPFILPGREPTPFFIAANEFRRPGVGMPPPQVYHPTLPPRNAAYLMRKSVPMPILFFRSLML